MPTHGHASPATDEAPRRAPRQSDADSWHRMTHDAVVMAWSRDPEVMCDLVATLMDIHLRRCRRRPEATLDELHLMISLELHELCGDPG